MRTTIRRGKTGTSVSNKWKSGNTTITRTIRPGKTPKMTVSTKYKNVTVTKSS